jgi:hypothetical protein
VTRRPTTARLPPLFWVDGTVTDVGERLSKGEATTVFRSLEICRRGGRVQRLTVVRAPQEIATLIEQHCIGMFFFLQQTEECRLWCVARADGPHRVDIDTMQQIIPTFPAGRVTDAR